MKNSFVPAVALALALSAGTLCAEDVVKFPSEKPLTAGSALAAAPQVDVATQVFSLPGVRFMQKVRVHDSLAEVSVSGLPKGLRWNAARTLIEGVVNKEGTYYYDLHVVTPQARVDTTILLTVSKDLQQPTPMMGWLSWNVFEWEIDEAKVKEVAAAWERYGLLKAGYRYLCLDDLWHAKSREEGTGKPRFDAEKFPSGLKALADHVHTKGLKFGIYSDAAPYTCAGAFGSLGYEAVDARQYAEWGFDLLKYDYCHAPEDVETAIVRYTEMGDALKASGRDILFYVCEWGARSPWLWGARTGGSCWRCTYDTRDCWCGQPGGIGVLQSIEGMRDIWPWSGPNRFNDADMLCVGLHGTGKSSNALTKGKPGMTQTEYRTQFSLWCMWSSPLMLSFDLRNISNDDLAIITNAELIALDQDPLGQQAEYLGEHDGVQLYAKDLANGDVAVAVVNVGDASARYTIDFSKVPALSAKQVYRMRDLWQHVDLGRVRGSHEGQLAAHETHVFRLSK